MTPVTPLEPTSNSSLQGRKLHLESGHKSVLLCIQLESGVTFRQSSNEKIIRRSLPKWCDFHSRHTTRSTATSQIRQALQRLSRRRSQGADLYAELGIAAWASHHQKPASHFERPPRALEGRHTSHSSAVPTALLLWIFEREPTQVYLGGSLHREVGQHCPATTQLRHVPGVRTIGQATNSGHLGNPAPLNWTTAGVSLLPRVPAVGRVRTMIVRVLLQL